MVIMQFNFSNDVRLKSNKSLIRLVFVKGDLFHDFWLEWPWIKRLDEHKNDHAENILGGYLWYSWPILAAWTGKNDCGD